MKFWPILSIVILALCPFSYVSSHRDTAEVQVTCDASQCQGRPGKRGAVGPRGFPGLRGEKGDRGTSKRLEDKVDILEELLDDMKEKLRIQEDSLRDLKRGLMKDQALKEKVCYMGMKSREIPDSSISASSHAPPGNVHRERLGRLDNRQSGGQQGAWCSGANRVGQWIQVDFRAPKRVAGVITQGRPQYCCPIQVVTSYKVKYGNSTNSLQTISVNDVEKVFNANRDRDTKVVRMFPAPVTCRYIRVYPQSWSSHMSMRVEFIHGRCYDVY